MSKFEMRELTDAELAEVSGGEYDEGIFWSSADGINFEYNSRTHTTYIWAGSFGNGVECNGNGHCRPL